jgi:hypothetical protein
LTADYYHDGPSGEDAMHSEMEKDAGLYDDWEEAESNDGSGA